MKTLLPILKTKLFLLGFVSTCTVILATTVPQIRNFIASEKTIGENLINALVLPGLLRWQQLDRREQHHQRPDGATKVKAGYSHGS